MKLSGDVRVLSAEKCIPEVIVIQDLCSYCHKLPEGGASDKNRVKCTAYALFASVS